MEQVDEESQPAPAAGEPEKDEPAQIEEQPVEQEVEQPQEIEQENKDIRNILRNSIIINHIPTYFIFLFNFLCCK